ncbi:hypothetical protein [Paracidovorax avenae]|uniref:hypothetical protein n=1 Tax=Paracidovorax avenae TaxID=80867 RepID=UPI00126031BE|nr:hypothetical protein [Paracidovorax avenae]
MKLRLLMLILFLLAYDATVLFSGFGNYYHGSGYYQSLLIDVLAVLLLWLVFRSFVHANFSLKLSLVALMVVPLLMLLGIFYRLFYGFLN